MSRRKIITNQKFGRLIAIKIDEERSTPQRTYWLCQCDCGNPKLISVYLYSLTSKKTKSCGCIKKEGIVYKKHGETSKDKNHKSRLYSIWDGMIQRCTNSKNTRYNDYGGRGIKICEEWMDFIKFKDWALNNNYKNHLTIDRVDNDSNYTPDNCRWVTSFIQARNKRDTLYVMYKNKKYGFCELLQEKQLSEYYKQIYTRIFDFNWSIEESIDIPIGIRRKEYSFIKAIETEFENKQSGYIILKKDFKKKHDISTQDFKYYIMKDNVKNILDNLNIKNETFRLVKF